MLDDKWDSGYRHLVEYADTHGSAQVLQSYVADDGYRLGKWVSVQRRIWDKLDGNRKQRLAQLRGWTLDARGNWWEDWFRRLEESWPNMTKPVFPRHTSRRMAPSLAPG